MSKRKCIVCGREFERSSSAQKFCSPECRTLSQKSKNKKITRKKNNYINLNEAARISKETGMSYGELTEKGLI